jgi:transposase InsO family protein
MQDRDDELRRAVALFRYGLIAELLHLPVGSSGITTRLRDIAEQVYTIPGSRRTRVAAETLRDWLKAYRRGGFDALLPQPRADLGQPRRLPAAIAELLVATKEQHPQLSVRRVIQEARQTGQLPDDLKLPPSTVHRLLSREGLMVKGSGQHAAIDRRRFAFREAAELWMSDVMHGPKVTAGQRRHKTYLIAFIDDATRVIPYAAFAAAENTAAFLPVFKQALIRRGLPLRLYVDNGANYRSQQLALVCAKLGVALIHARPYQPQAKGKIERWFRTVRAQLLTCLSETDCASLDTLNRRLWAWIEGEYHQTPHRGLNGKTPLEQWALVADQVRFVDRHLDLADLFLFETKRRVQKDRTISLNGQIYEVDAVLVGETVILRFDPSAASTRPIQVVHEGKCVGQATPLDAYANSFVKRDRPSQQQRHDQAAPQPARSPIALSQFPSDETDDTDELENN